MIKLTKHTVTQVLLKEILFIYIKTNLFYSNRPHVEYANSVWFRYKKGDTAVIERSKNELLSCLYL